MDNEFRMLNRYIEPEAKSFVPVAIYAPGFVNTELDIPDTTADPAYFGFFEAHINNNAFIDDIMLAHRIIESGVPNKLGLRIPLNTAWNTPLFDCFLQDYEDREVIDWLTFGFPISRSDEFPDPTPAECNHRGATLFPEVIDEYIRSEIACGDTMGPFSIPPFINRIGVSPLSTRPKRETGKRRIIMDLSFPMGASVNDGIDKDWYCGTPIKLTYPTIDVLAE